MDREKKTEEMKGGRTNTELYVQIAIIGVLALFMMFNIGKIYGGGGSITGNAILTRVSASEIIPTGMPEVYGKEIGISYDDVSAADPRLADETISKMRMYEDMELTETEMNRYIDIAGAISCEYCCGVNAIIYNKDDVEVRDKQIQKAIEKGEISVADASKYRTKAGDSACGCAHSYAMRGLAKYLLRNHPNMSDDDILTELAKWKTLYFPGQMELKAEVLKKEGIEFNYINLGSNKYRGIEQGTKTGTSDSMVGGC